MAINTAMIFGINDSVISLIWVAACKILMIRPVTSELKTAFQIGFTIFIPFLIIDLVIASVLMALGMMMVPPATIALPFKLMLFVLVDGWQLLVGSLAQSFYS